MLKWLEKAATSQDDGGRWQVYWGGSDLALRPEKLEEEVVVVQLQGS